MTETCKLCELYEQRKIFTRLYEESDKVIVIQAFNKAGSKNPRLMAVLKRHTNTPTEDEKQMVEGLLKTVADRVSSQIGLNYELSVRESADHYHQHCQF
jgi:hypothetical protein